MDAEATEVFGSLVAATVVYSSFLKGEERVILSVQGNGALEGGYVEALACGEVRGYMNHARMPAIGDNIDRGIGAGTMTMQKWRYHQREPHTTTIGSLGETKRDFEALYAQSEQVPSLFHCDSIVSSPQTEATPLFCGGLLFEAIPTDDGTAAGEELIQRVRAQLATNEPSMTELMVAEGVEAYMTALMSKVDYADLESPEMVQTRTIPVDFLCRCSKPKARELVNVVA